MIIDGITDAAGTGIKDGLIETADLNTEAAAIKVGSNGIYNGKMTISQRGDFTTPTAIITDTYYLDRWVTYQSTITGTIQDMGGSQKLTATSTGTGYIQSRQFIERYQDYANKTVTFSARVKSTIAGVRLRILTNESDDYSNPHSGNGEWEDMSITVTLGAATDLRPTIGSYYLGHTAHTTGQYYEFTDVRLDVGDKRLTGDREYGEELALCQRYYFKNFGGQFAILGQLLPYSTDNAKGYTVVPVPMRIVPTITTLALVGRRIDDNGTISSLTVDVNYTGTTYVGYTIVGSSFIADTQYFLAGNSPVSFIAFDAEL